MLTPAGIKAVFAVHVDTSTSVRNDIAAIRRAIDAADHPALLMVDCIASLACDKYLMDEWGVDVTVGASQKGLMVPPGLGFGGPARGRCQRTSTPDCGLGTGTGPPARKKGRTTCATAAHRRCRTCTAYSEALAIVREETLECVWDRHATLAGGARGRRRLGGARRARAQHRRSRCTINAVTMIRTGGIDGFRLRELCEEPRAGLTLGIGLAPYEQVSFASVTWGT